MKHIISKRLISFFLSIILGISLVVPVMAEVAVFSVASPILSGPIAAETSPLVVLGGGVGRATPTNLSYGWPGVATPTDLQGGWDEVFAGDELTAVDATTNEPISRIYMDVGNTAVLTFKDRFSAPTLDIESIEFSFTLDSKPFDATDYFNVEFNKEKQIATVMPKMPLLTFNEDNTVKGYRLAMKLTRAGQKENIVYLYLVRNPVAVSVVVNPKDKIFIPGENYVLGLDPALPFKGTVQALILNENAPAQNITASINEANNSINVSVAQDCPMGFYRLRLTGESDKDYYFTDALIYVSDLVLYDVNSLCETGEVTYDIPFDYDERTFLIGDKNGIFDKDIITKISVTPSAILNMSGASVAKGNGITVSPNGELGTEEIAITATLKDGTIRHGIFKANCKVRAPLMLIEHKSDTGKLVDDEYTTVNVKKDLFLYINGKCVKDNPNLFRNITIDVSAQKPKVNFTADNAMGLVSITSYYIGVTSTIISVNYEEFDELSNVWAKRSASFAQTVNAKPAKIYSGALCVNDSGKYKPVNLYDNFRIGQTINITACEYGDNESYVPIEQDLKLEFSAKAFKDNIAQELPLDEYLTIKPLPNAANTFEVTCLKLPPMGVWVMIYAQTKLQTCRYQCQYIIFAKTFNSYMHIAIDGTSIYAGIISLHPNSASKLVFNAMPTTSGQQSFDLTTITNDKIRIYEAALNENSAKKDATEFFVIEKLTGKEFGYSITPKSNCPTKPMSISLYIENPNEYFQIDNINVIAGDIFLVDSSGFVIDEISPERDGTAKSYYFSDSNGTVTGDRVKNIAVTGVDCGVDIFENYFSVYHKSQTLVDKTATIVLTLKDDTVYTFNMKFDDLYKGRDIVLVNKNGVEINDCIFALGTPETFYFKAKFPLDKTKIFLQKPQSVDSYMDLKFDKDNCAVTILYNQIPTQSEIETIEFKIEKEHGCLYFNYNSNLKNIISNDSPMIISTSNKLEGHSLLVEPAEFTVLIPSGKKVSNIELKARDCSNRVIIKKISDNKFLVSPNIDSLGSTTIYAEITYEDGSGDYCETLLRTKNQTLLNDTLPNRKRLSFAIKNNDGSLRAISQHRDWDPNTLYLAQARDTYNYDIMPCDDANIKSVEIISSNPAALTADVAKTADKQGYVIKYQIYPVEYTKDIVLTAQITYQNGEVRKAYIIWKPYYNIGEPSRYIEVPKQEDLELQGTTLQEYLSKATIRSYDSIAFLGDNYKGNLSLNRPFRISGNTNKHVIINGSIYCKWSTVLSGLNIKGTDRKGIGVSGSAVLQCSEVSGFDIGVDAETYVYLDDVDIYDCNIGAVNLRVQNCNIKNCNIGILNGMSYGSTLENNKVAIQSDGAKYVQEITKNKLINNEINIENKDYDVYAEQNYFSKTKNADGTLLKEPINYPYAASIKGNVKVEPYFLDEAMTKLSIVLPQDPNGTVNLKPTNTVTNEDGTTTKEATVTIDNPTGDAKINDAVFEAAGNASASTDATTKVDNLVFEVKSEKAETEIKWSFSTEELKKNYDKPEEEQIKAPSLSVKFDFDSLAPEQEEKLTAEEVLAKNSIKEIIKETIKKIQDLKPGTESILYQSISFSHSGKLPAPATITIKKNAALSQPGALDVLRIYWFNPAKGALEAMLDELDSDGDKDFKEYLPIKDNKDEGTISFVITHCSEYIVAAESSKETAIINPDTTAVFDITAIKMTKPIDELKISTDKEFVSNIKLGSTVGNILSCLNPANALTAKKDGVALSATDTISTGTRIVYEVGANPNPTERAHITAVIYGDASGDGAVDVADLIIIQGRILSGTKTVDPKNALDVAANIVDSAALTLDVGDLLSVRAHLLKANLIDQNL